MSKTMNLALVVAGLLGIAACTPQRDLATVDHVDLQKYSGTWYDIAHLPQKFEEGCKCVSAEYIPKENYVKVINTCVDEESDEMSQASGKAFSQNPDNSKLRVQFFWPFRGDYYIIALRDDYKYAMVGSPDRTSLWILSRDPQPSAMVLKEYLNKAEQLGFDTSAMIYTDQSCNVRPDIQGKSK